MEFGGVGEGRRAVVTQIDRKRHTPSHPGLDPAHSAAVVFGVLVGSPDFVIVLVTDLKLWTGAIPTLSNDVHVQQTPDRTVSGRVLTVSVVFSRPKTV